MIDRWLLLLVSLVYVGVLFGIAWFGDRRPLYPSRPFLRPVVYGLALAVYCSSWTFYGAVGTAARNGLAYVPIYLGPILLFAFGMRLMQRLALIARQRSITSIADFLAARFGKSQGLAALVTVIAITASVPYIALQFKAVATSVGALTGASAGQGAAAAASADAALCCAGVLALFAILFGTRRIDATEHHHGMMLAIAAESLVKLLAFAAVAVFAWYHGPGLAATVQPFVDQLGHGLPSGFLVQTMLAMCAVFCLPRQFQVAFVECEDPADTQRARWIFPGYLLAVCILVLPIVAASRLLPQLSTSSMDSWLLRLPMAHDAPVVALLAYIGGFSAATGMVIVATVALATMVSNDLVMPALLRIRRLHLERREDVSAIVLGVRRLAIVVLAAAAYAYDRVTGSVENLAAMGLLAFVAVVQFAPAIIAALYWRAASRRGVLAGLGVGYALWIYTLLLPSMAQAGWLPQSWLLRGPLGIGWLAPQALFNVRGWDPIVHGTFWSLLANVGTLVFVSLRFRPSVDERINAAAFLDPYAENPHASEDWRGRITVADLQVIAERIVGERAARRAFEDYAFRRQRELLPLQAADRALIQYTERLLAAAIGAASARRMLMSALSGTGVDVGEAMALLDEASQELRFNRGLLAAALENVAQGISVVDADMRLVMWNRPYLDIFEYPEGMVFVGRPVADLIGWNAERGEYGPGEVDEHVRKRLAHMRAGTPHVFQRIRPDGSVLELRGRALPEGGYVTTYTDITSYKNAELALIEANETLEQRVARRTAELSEALAAQEQAKREAEAANASKTRFLAAASHDLLQPLNAARLFTSALRQLPDLDQEAVRLGERIDSAFRTAEDLLDMLLEASRLDAGRYQPESIDLSLRELFEPLHAQFAVLAAQRGLSLRMKPGVLAVRSDPQLLRRILQNFLSNALRYTRHGGVLLGARRRGDRVRIEVWDSGPGIEPDQQRVIFNEFQRAASPSPWGEKGLGLGLSICERMANILGHRLSLASRPGKGSCFAVEVPMVRLARVAVSLPSEHDTVASGLPAQVLCVDNDEAILDGMSALLARWNVHGIPASGLHQAEAALRTQVVDALLVDYHLDDGMNGIVVLEQLRQRLGQLPPCALITADNSAELKQQARMLGFPILRKPVKPAALRALLAALARKNR